MLTTTCENPMSDETECVLIKLPYRTYRIIVVKAVGFRLHKCIKNFSIKKYKLAKIISELNHV